MRDNGGLDLLYAALLLPAEAYIWLRVGHFLTAWAQFFGRVEKNNWAAQAAAERGRGSAHIMPAIFAVAVFGVLIYAWSRQSNDVKSAILSVGWPVLYLVTILQTVFMLKKLVRRQRGFSV